MRPFALGRYRVAATGCADTLFGKGRADADAIAPRDEKETPLHGIRIIGFRHSPAEGSDGWRLGPQLVQHRVHSLGIEEAVDGGAVGEVMGSQPECRTLRS